MPFSDLASAEAQAAFIDAQKPLALFSMSPPSPIAEMRRLMKEQYFNRRVAKQRAAFRVTMHGETVGGIYK